MKHDFIHPIDRKEVTKIKSAIEQKEKEVEELQKKIDSMNDINKLNSKLAELDVQFELSEISEIDLKKSKNEIEKEIQFIKKTQSELSLILNSKRTAIEVLQDRLKNTLQDAEKDYLTDIEKALEKSRKEVAKEVIPFEQLLKKHIALELFYLSETGNDSSYLNTFYSETAPQSLRTISLFKDKIDYEACGKIYYPLFNYLELERG